MSPEPVTYNRRSTDMHPDRSLEVENRMTRMETSIENVDRKVDGITEKLERISAVLTDLHISHEKRGIQYDNLKTDFEKLENHNDELKKKVEVLCDAVDTLKDNITTHIETPEKNTELTKLAAFSQSVKMYTNIGIYVLIFLVVLNVLGKDFGINILKIFSAASGTGH